MIKPITVIQGNKNGLVSITQGSNEIFLRPDEISFISDYWIHNEKVLTDAYKNGFKSLKLNPKGVK